MNPIYHRVSIRKYQERPVENEKILQILKAVAKWSDLDNVRYFYDFFKKHENEFT